MRKTNGSSLAVLTLAFAVLAAASSGCIETIVLTNPEGSWVRWCAGVSGRMFTVSAMLLLLFALQRQRAKLTTRLEKLEQELSAFRSRAA